MIVLVTDELIVSLGKTHSVITETNEAADQTRAGLNDRNHYHKTVNALADLCQSMLRAQAAIPLLDGGPKGAGFDLGSGTKLAATLSSAVAYLRGGAATVSQDASRLSGTQSFCTVEALSHLKALNYMLIDAIRMKAQDDLSALKALGPVALITAAVVLAGGLAEETAK